MGKTLKVVAGVIGIAAIVIPGVGPMITGTLGGMFAGGNAALLAGGASAALAHGAAATITSALMMAGSPMADMEPIHFNGGLMHGSMGLPLGRPGVTECMLPIRRWWHFPRFRFARMSGRCMEPHCGNGAHMLIDRAVEIRAGDLVAIRTTNGLVAKRFVRFDRDGLVVETTNPTVQRYFIPIDKLKWVYRIRAHGASRRSLVRAAMEIQQDEDAHCERLASVVMPVT